MRIAEVLEEYGWGTNRFVGENGELCLYAAKQVACYGAPSLRDVSRQGLDFKRGNDVFEVLDRIVKERGYPNVTAFNDAPETTYEDVLLVAKLTDVEMGL